MNCLSFFNKLLGCFLFISTTLGATLLVKDMIFRQLVKLTVFVTSNADFGITIFINYLGIIVYRAMDFLSSFYKLYLFFILHIIDEIVRFQSIFTISFVMTKYKLSAT